MLAHRIQSESEQSSPAKRIRRRRSPRQVCDQIPMGLQRALCHLREGPAGLLCLMTAFASAVRLIALSCRAAVQSSGGCTLDCRSLQASLAGFCCQGCRPRQVCTAALQARSMHTACGGRPAGLHLQLLHHVWPGELACASNRAAVQSWAGCIIDSRHPQASLAGACCQCCSLPRTALQPCMLAAQGNPVIQGEDGRGACRLACLHDQVGKPAC